MRQRRFEARNRNEIVTDAFRQSFSQPFMSSTMSMTDPGKSSKSFGSHSSSGPLMSATTGAFYSSIGSTSLSDSSPKPHRFAHSAARYYPREAHPGPPPPAAPSSPVRTRLNKRGERMTWRQGMEDLAQSKSLPSLSRSSLSEPTTSQLFSG